MNYKSEVKKKLSNGEVVLGTWLTIGHNAIAEIMSSSGFDWIAVDLEHTTISIETAGELIRTIDLCGSSPLVRLTSNNENQIKRVMDAGAHGIIVPSVNTPEEAERAVKAVKYAPLGNRGVGLGRAQEYGRTFKEHYEWQKTQPLVIVQIENIFAVKHLEDILTTDGVDGFMVGPYDLSCSMGIPGQFEAPEFEKVLAQIEKVGLQVGCPSGYHLVEPDCEKLKGLCRQGYNFIAYSVDFKLLNDGLGRGVTSFKEELNK
ncbi:HpcH/HpaI aldolase family protein [Vibrio sinaloensis]|uniref:HpcH/HpaI aldolase family protein n=1 Tax=Photobacterium sp. (strain ATCC 43367) TaxID=379097 RepID=UPI00204F4852|nr:aldolase/citrate lyase family protein [Vibrio sinaloensis]UPQ88106.1 aldolase/citrate lyase family protein [Vibrio sinaloensis]